MVECTFAEGLQTRLPTMEPRRVSAAKGLIRMRPRSNTYAFTSDGIWVAIFYTNVYGRVLRPLLALDYAQLPHKAAKHSVSSTPPSSPRSMAPVFSKQHDKPDSFVQTPGTEARGAR